MKKIFAIALALVMVLSMASAFAMTCTTGYDWSCSTTTYNCGKATVEVVPYVVANACDGKGVEYVESTCAAAVYGQKVYYAVKVTVPADINEEWFDEANLSIKLTGLKGGKEYTGGLPIIKGDADYTKKELVYYVHYDDNDWTATSAAADGFDIANVVMSATVKNAKTAKVCATLTSDYAPNGDYVEVADWSVIYRKGDSNLVFDVRDGENFKYSAAIVHLDENDKVVWVASDYECDANVDGKFVGWKDGQLVKAGGGLVSTSCGAAAKVAAVLKYFNLDFGTCVTEDAIEANFGWDDEVKDCFSWSSTATAIVDAECVVAIPKTGDVSVVAYAVMAVVAAAGTMLKK